VPGQDRPRLLNTLAETFAERLSRRGCLLIVRVAVGVPGVAGPSAATPS